MGNLSWHSRLFQCFLSHLHIAQGNHSVVEVLVQQRLPWLVTYASGLQVSLHWSTTVPVHE